jgi:hypothetical protein
MRSLRWAYSSTPTTRGAVAGGSGSEAISSRVFRLTGAPKTSVIREPAPACEGKADREQGRSQPFGPPTEPAREPRHLLGKCLARGRTPPRRRIGAPVTSPRRTCRLLADHEGSAGRSRVFGPTSTRIPGMPPGRRSTGPRPGRPCRTPRRIPPTGPPLRRTAAHTAAGRTSLTAQHWWPNRPPAGCLSAISVTITRRSTVTLRTRPQRSGPGPLRTDTAGFRIWGSAPARSYLRRRPVAR